MNFNFNAIFILGILSAIGFVLWRWSLTFEEPRLSFSSIKDFKDRGIRGELYSIPKMMKWISLCLLILAFIDPHYYVERDITVEKNIPTEGLAIYLVLDQSGSMGKIVDRSGRKIDILKRVTKDFVKGNADIGLRGRPNDMIGLVAYARGAQVMSPLTLDHDDVIRQLNSIDIIRDAKQDGTSIGYAIYKTVNLITATRQYAEEQSNLGKPSYEIKNGIIILVTDGLQAPNPLDSGKRLRNMDISEAGEIAKQNGVRLYIINVEPKLVENPQLNLMKRVAEMTGGKFYLSQNLEEIYSDIDQIEKSLFSDMKYNPKKYERVPLYPWIIAFGLFFLVFGIFLDATVFRRIP